MSHKKRNPSDHMCGEKMFWNCDEYVNRNTHHCYMKPIVINDESQEDKKKKTKKNKQKRRQVLDEMLVEESIEEGKKEGEDEENEEGQEYLFFDIES